MNDDKEGSGIRVWLFDKSYYYNIYIVSNKEGGMKEEGNTIGFR